MTRATRSRHLHARLLGPGTWLLDRFVYWAFRAVILIARPFPVAAGYWVASRAAVVCYLTIFHRQRRALRANLSRVLNTDDPSQVDRVARRSFRNFGKYVIDFIHYPDLTREEIQRRLKFTQWPELNETVDSGRGVIIATLHFGSWDLGAAALATYGYPIHAIGEQFRYPPMNALVFGSREKLGMNVIAGDRVGPAVFRALRRGEMLAMLVDVANEGEGERVDFFGAPALVSTAAARIALRTGAWMVPAVVMRGPANDLEVRPIVHTSLRDFAPTGDEAADALELTRLVLRAVEPSIRDHPEQWFIFRRLWEDSGA